MAVAPLADGGRLAVDHARERHPAEDRSGLGLAPRLGPAAPRIVGSAPPHVLQVFQPDIGGVPRYAASLAAGLVAEGWRVSVACPPNAWVCDGLRAAGVEILPFEVPRAPHPWRDAGALRNLMRWCTTRQVSLIHGHSTKAGLLVALAGRGVGVPTVYTPHGWAFEMRVSPVLRGTYALVERQLAHHFHASLLTVSASGRAAGERWRVAPRGRIQVVRTGLPDVRAMDRLAARRTLGVRPDEVVAAWVGRVGAQKRPRDLISIARGVGRAVTIVALCDGAHGDCLADELRAAGVVLAEPGSEPAAVYAAADMVLHTSEWEACPLVVLEAMSASLPVIAYSVGGVPEQVQPGRTGYLVERGDIAMMCQCLLSLARNQDLRTRMGQAGHARAHSMFDYESMLERITRAYVAVLGPTGTGDEHRARRRESVSLAISSGEQH